MGKIRFVVAGVFFLCVSSELLSNEAPPENHQSKQSLIEKIGPANDWDISAQETPNGSFGCDTPPYEKGHACNPVWTKYDEARIRKMFRLQLAFCEKQHLPIILDMIDRMEKRLREEGFNRPLCD